MSDKPRCSNGDIKYPEDIWRTVRPTVQTYAEALAVSALVLAERERCLNIVQERCEGDVDFAAYLIKVEP